MQQSMQYAPIRLNMLRSHIIAKLCSVPGNELSATIRDESCTCTHKVLQEVTALPMPLSCACDSHTA